MSDALPRVVRTIADVRSQVQVWRDAGLTVGLVPTMGALHHGHLSLVDTIGQKVDRVIVSIFVNPTQFGEGEDFDVYPRDEDADLAKLLGRPCHLVYAPSPSEMYPQGFVTSVRVIGISDDLEGTERPGHFNGVATVVAKLLHQTRPHKAIFGEKDYQQLVVIRQFVRDLDIPVDIMGGALIREDDGLAASSRNAYLTASGRQIASKLYKTLQAVRDDIKDGKPVRQAEAKGRTALISEGFTDVDYITLRDAATLKEVDDPAGTSPMRLLAVARIKDVRLLDNIPVEDIPL